ncbi:hypothetical protein CEXT_436831 [Caerostris extrusa]|uniref:Uncharacterized protein n=1 Tax=Caerostris extrusa TaxID=172846 RepID=A0AAV4XF73_CAEEX|nr:hypothetical protein CEXT_436831 [Caerostris extrusa]
MLQYLPLADGAQTGGRQGSLFDFTSLQSPPTDGLDKECRLLWKSYHVIETSKSLVVNFDFQFCCSLEKSRVPYRRLCFRRGVGGLE